MMPITTDAPKGKKSPTLFSRVKEEDFEEAKRVAEDHFDGNLSILVRIAVKRLVSSYRESSADEADNAKALVA